MKNKKQVEVIKEASLTAAAVLIQAHQEAIQVLDTARVKADQLMQTEVKVAKEKTTKATENAKLILNKAIELAEAKTA